MRMKMATNTHRLASYNLLFTCHLATSIDRNGLSSIVKKDSVNRQANNSYKSYTEISPFYVASCCHVRGNSAIRLSYHIVPKYLRSHVSVDYNSSHGISGASGGRSVH